MTHQLELSLGAPFSLRLNFSEALSFFWDKYWITTVKSKNTKKCFKVLSQYFQRKYIDEITKSDIESLRNYLGGLGLKPNSVNTYHLIVTRLYNKLFEWKEGGRFECVDFSYISMPNRNPASLVPKVNEKQFERRVAWPKKTVRKMITAALALNDIELAQIIQILYLTRLRPGDVWSIVDRNVDLTRLILFGIQNKTITRRNPSGIPYMIALTDQMARIFKQRLDKTPSGQPLFRDPRMTYSAWLKFIQRRFNAAREVANLKHVQLRDFRPSSATLLLDNGIDPETVRESLGHTTLRMLPTYTPRTIVHQRRAQRVLEKEDSEILM